MKKYPIRVLWLFSNFLFISIGFCSFNVYAQIDTVPLAPLGCTLELTGPITETVIGNTTYDLQTNSSVQDRIIQHADGSLSVAWTFSQELNQTYSDRGTGYFYYDGSSWSSQPASRLESSRCGWPTILAPASGGELIIAHNTSFNYMQSVFRDTVGSGNWNEQVVSMYDSSTFSYRYLSWNRSAMGGPTGNTVHMIALTAPTGNGGTIYNGMDGALLYYRSLDGGVTWDIQDAQLPTLDQFNFLGFDGDGYAIHARENTVVIAVFGEWYDSFIMKSTDNGNTWTRTNFLDFPVDLHIVGNGIDLDGNSTYDDLYTTDASGAVLIDHNGLVHVVAGNMRHLDEATGGGSWFPTTNGLLYWNETMEPDTAMTTSINDTWWSDNMVVIAGATDLDGDSVVAGIDVINGNQATYFTSGLSSFPSMGIDGNDHLYVSFSAYTETMSSPIGGQVYRHINIIKSYDGGNNWTCPVDITALTSLNGQRECVFGSMVTEVDDRVRIVYQRDEEPGLAVRGDLDPDGFNEIVYMEIDTGFVSYGCTDLQSCNYDPSATVSNGTCIYSNGADAGADRTICRGDTVHLHATGGQQYSWTPTSGLDDPSSANPIAGPNFTTSYIVTTTAGSCTDYDTVTVNVFLITDTISVSACSSYTIPGFPFPITTSGIYPITLQTQSGCDSSIIYDLTIYTEVTPTVYVNGNIVFTDTYASYQWLFNGLAISGATGQSFTVPVDGFYSVEVTDSEGCNGESQLVFVLASGTPVCDSPDSTWVTGITDTSANVNWSVVSGATGYLLNWRETGTSSWNFYPFSSAVIGVNLTNLNQITSYEYQALSICGSDTSAFTPLDTFTTTGGPECEVSFTWVNSSGTTMNYILSPVLQVGTVTVFLWDYGDGNQSAEFLTTGSHVYANAGVYVACVQLVTSTGCLADYCDTITVGNPALCIDGSDTVFTDNITTSTAVLTWAAVPGVDHFLIRGGLAGSSNPAQIIINNGAATARNVGGLNPSTSYQWQIKAYCDWAETEESAWSALSVFTTATPPPCFVPTGLNTNPITSNGARLNWTPTTGAIGYRIQGRVAPGPGWPVSIIVNGGTTAHKDVFGLNPNNTYDWRISSNCGNGNSSAYSAHTSFTTNAGTRLAGSDTFDPESNMDLSVVPNPFNQLTRVEFPNPGKETFHLQLIDMTGNVVRQLRSINDNHCYILRDGLSAGLYFIELRSASATLRGKVVVE